MAETTLQYDEKALEKLCREYHVRRLDVFGSQAKDTVGAGSVCDLLIRV